MTPSHDVSLVKQPATTQNSAPQEASATHQHKRVNSYFDGKPPLSTVNKSSGSQSTSGCQSRLESAGLDEDEILIVEVQLGNKVKTQLQIARSQNISEVSREFCKQHGKWVVHLTFRCRAELRLRGQGRRDPPISH